MLMYNNIICMYNVCISHRRSGRNRHGRRRRLLILQRRFYIAAVLIVCIRNIIKTTNGLEDRGGDEYA